MPSLEFQNLPLIEVVCNLVMGDHRVLSWDDLVDLREALRADLPHVKDFFSGFSSPVGFAVGAAPGAAYESDSGSRLEIRPDRITSAWRLSSTSSKYVRFQSLLSTLETAMVTIGGPSVSVVNMVYVNRVPNSQGSIRDLILPELLPALNNADVLDYNIAWTLQNGGEFRLQVSPSDELSLITTVAGKKCQGDWKADLVQIHDTLQAQFIKVITPKAKDEWKWQPS